ncbi:MAG: CHASE2 domain-containing protein [Alphaproteobacteria bacterium]|nr:CHASE2 domain-containing protein [Alphaproteobacteria bacterium]
MFSLTPHRSLRALQSWRPELLIWLTVAAGAVFGLFAGLQNTIDDAMFWVTERTASGDIVIVQIDPRSLAAVETWPWPRSRHAEAIDKLSAAGAEIIGVDIDFSSPSRATDDARLAKAIGDAAGHVVLPSFVQHATPGAGSEMIETNPLPMLREGSLIGNANVFAPEGEARRGSIGLYLPDGRYRPTFAGLIGQRGQSVISEFDIDFAVNPSTFKRLSFVDVLNGTFDPAVVKGKRVIIGATAVELGDRVPVARHGVIAGVELQALIAESIGQGRMLLPTGPIGSLVLVGLVLAIVRPSRANWSFNGFGQRFLLCAAAIFIGPIVVLSLAPLIVETAPALCALGGCFLYVGSTEFASRARTAIRERSAANMRRAMINLIVEESSDGVVVANRAGRIELCNERAGHLLNSTRAALLGRNAAAHLPSFDSMPPSGDADDTQRHTDLTVDCDDEPITLEVRARRLALHVSHGVGGHDPRLDVYTLRDVTAKRRALAAERQAQADRLTTERAKSNFIANMSHELRTPLNAIIGFSEMIANETLGPAGQPKYVEFSDLVVKSGHHLLTLINNVLEISRIDDNPESMEVGEFDFRECMESCVSLARRLRDHRHHTIIAHLSGPPVVKADQRLVRQVLFNLLANAVKFTGDHGNVSVSAWSEGDAFVFEVSDDGVGIEQSLMPHLTELFYQPDKSFTRKHEGMGVGLYLVKRYLDMMKGLLHIESEPGKGTTVRVTLPGAAVPEAAARSAA